jgi:branched-chain amino acid transport system substrate-binding protein
MQKMLLATAVATAPMWAAAQETVKIANVIELSGPGASVGGNWTHGVEMAAEEINAKRGILGRKIEIENYDTQTNPGVAKAMVQKAIDRDPYVVLGPIYSGSVMVSMAVAQAARVPQLVGAQAAAVTAGGNPYIFRTTFNQLRVIPMVSAYMVDQLKAKSVGILWVNNDFGKGGRDAFLKEMAERKIPMLADISTEQGQVDFSSAVLKAKAANVNAIFAYTNEEESARFLKEARKQGLQSTLVGATTLLNDKVLELAGPAANGVRGLLELSAQAPVPTVQEFVKKFSAKYKAQPDHAAAAGYVAMYTVKYTTEKLGVFDRAKFAETLRGLSISAKDEPGILLDTTWTSNGDVLRQAFIAEIVDGKQRIIATLPKGSL